MVCHQKIALDLNADCAEFCPYDGYHNWLAVGTYQLDESSSTRQGRLYLYSTVAPHGAEGPQLRLRATLDLPGIFDLQWMRPLGLQTIPHIGLALADGSLSIVTAQQELQAQSAKASAATSESKHSYRPSSFERVQDDPMTLHKVCGCQAVTDSMALFLDWHPQRNNICAVTSSSGAISVMQVHEGGVQQVLEWPAHDLEAWIASWDRYQGHVLYSGSDDCSFKGWDIRLPNSTVSASSSDQPAPQQSAIFSNRKSHSAGVTCISSHPRQDHVLVTGSYDEHVRLWDLRMIQRPVESCQVSTGGGVWRLKWHPRNDLLLLAACMYQGFALVSASEDWGSLQVVEEYKGHDSIAYGADWYRGNWSGTGEEAADQGLNGKAEQILDGEVAESSEHRDQHGHRDLIATCSFYDRSMHLWSPESVV